MSEEIDETNSNFVPYYLRKDLKHNRGKKSGSSNNQRRRRKSVTEVIFDFHKNQAQTTGESLSETQILSKVSQTKVLLTQQVQEQDTKEVKRPTLPSLKDFDKFSLRNDQVIRESLSLDCSPRGLYSPVSYSPLTQSPRTQTNSPTFKEQISNSNSNFTKDMLSKIPLKLQKEIPKILNPISSPRNQKQQLNSPRLQEVYSSPRPRLTETLPKQPQSPRGFQEVPMKKIPNFDSLTPKNYDYSPFDSSSSRESSPRLRLSSPRRQRVEPYYTPQYRDGDTSNSSSRETSPRRRGYSLSMKRNFGNKIDELINHEEEDEQRNVAQSPNLTISVGLNGDIITINDQFSSILGYKKDELVKKSLRLICDENPLNQNFYQKLLEGNQSADIQLKFIHKNGDPIDTLIKVKLIHEEVFNKHFFLCIIYDVMRDLKTILGKLTIQ